jgi:hypothetical protein
MFVKLTDARRQLPVMVNLDNVLYAYREPIRNVTVIVFGKVPVARMRQGTRVTQLQPIALSVMETLAEVQEKRRLGG